MPTDAERLDFLDRWVQSAMMRGLVWDTFTFNSSRPVRDQLDEQMQYGLVELQKHAHTSASEEPT